MYKNIIFDLGGVVVDFKPRDFLMDHFLNKSAEDEVFDLTFGSKEWEELDRGVISRGTANRLMLENAAERGRTFEVQAVIDEWQSILHTNKRTVKTMCKLKLAGYRLYYLSNISQDVIDEIRQRDCAGSRWRPTTSGRRHRKHQRKIEADKTILGCI